KLRCCIRPKVPVNSCAIVKQSIGCKGKYLLTVNTFKTGYLDIYLNFIIKRKHQKGGIGTKESGIGNQHYVINSSIRICVRRVISGTYIIFSSRVAKRPNEVISGIA